MSKRAQKNLLRFLVVLLLLIPVGVVALVLLLPVGLGVVTVLLIIFVLEAVVAALIGLVTFFSGVWFFVREEPETYDKAAQSYTLEQGRDAGN